MRKRCSISLLFLLGWLVAEACTSAVVSGRVTRDGRPLLWKHRDASDLNNRVEQFDAQGDCMAFVGIVNGVDSLAREVWTGYNSAGFAVMNTASYNLKNDTSSLADREGIVMKRALQICRTVDDFATLLDTLPRPLGVEANFGVIDANGGAAYFEVNNTTVTRYNAADAPEGYLLRTNYSLSGRTDEGYGYIRYDNASRLFAQASASHTITPEWITGVCSRSFYHTLFKKEFTADEWVVDQDFIPRRSTSATLVVEGVRPDESPALTTMWTALGYPPCSITLPVWLGSKQGIPMLLQATGQSLHAPLCRWANELKSRVFSIRRGSGEHYLHMAQLYRPDGMGYTQQLYALEQELYMQAREVLTEMRNRGEWNDLQTGDVLARMQQQVIMLYEELLGE